MLKAVIFDLNGVFIHSPKLSDRFEKDFKVSPEQFLPKLNDIIDAVRRPGASPAFSYWESVLKEWGVPFTEEEFWHYWFAAETPSDEMIALAKELKTQGIKVITLSNNFKERAEYYGHYPWLHEVVDKAYFSYETGYVKPDPEAWKLVLKDLYIYPREALYFDDQEKNLRAAEALAISSTLFTGAQDARETIENFQRKEVTAPTMRLLCAGGIVLNSRREVALVKSGPDFWGFPKGHIDEGEDELTAARREIEEETGLTKLTFVKELGVYERYKGRPDGGDDMSELKEIHMFLFTTDENVLAPKDPWNPEARWITASEVSSMLTHTKDKEFFLTCDLRAE